MAHRSEWGHRFDSISLADLRGRRSAKWREYPPDVLPVWVAEMDYPIAEPIRVALVDMIERSDTGYAHAGGLAEAYAGFAARRWDHRVRPEWIVSVADVMVGLSVMIELVTDRGDPVVVHTPAYPPFFAGIAAIEREFVAAPLARRPDGRFEVDLDVLEDRFRAGARTYLLNNPHNPTGFVLRRAELDAVAALCDRYGVIVLADEVHAPLVYPGATFVPFAAIDAESAGRSVSLTSASKGWNLPGLKCALVVAHDEDTWKRVDRIHEETRLGRSIMGVAASIAAFTEGEAWLDDTLAYLDGCRRLTAEELAARVPGVAVTPAEATYLAWLDCRGLDLGDDPAAVFLERGRVALYSGPKFGAEGRGFARFNFATSRPIVTDAVARMGAAL
jgi:cystathionine beta-lyase